MLLCCVENRLIARVEPRITLLLLLLMLLRPPPRVGFPLPPAPPRDEVKLKSKSSPPGPLSPPSASFLPLRTMGGARVLLKLPLLLLGMRRW